MWTIKQRIMSHVWEIVLRRKLGKFDNRDLAEC